MKTLAKCPECKENDAGAPPDPETGWLAPCLECSERKRSEVPDPATGERPPVKFPEDAAAFSEFRMATGIGVFEYARLVGMHHDTMSRRSRGAIAMKREARELLRALTIAAGRGVNVRKMLERGARAR